MDESFKRQRVVITGIGTVTSYGNGVDSFWDSLLAGKSGLDRVQSFDTTEYACKVGAEALDFKPGDFMDPKEARRNDRFTQFAVAASKLALDDADIDPTKLDADRFGVLVGSGIGGMLTTQIQGRSQD